MKKHREKDLFVGACIAVACILLLALQSSPQKVRIGTYDSRAIALAYARSAKYAPVIKELKEKYAQAQAEKNEKLAKELENEGVTGHQLMQLQAFSIASVADIMEKVKESVPKVAKEAGVDIILSKWELAYSSSSAEIVDVTPHLVRLFNPDKQTLELIESLLQQPPLPLLQALQIKEG